jgi:RHS repeat-associated protein
VLIDGAIVPGVLGMVFDSRAARPIAPGANLAPPTGQVRVEHSDTLQLWDSVTAELWLKTTPSQSGAARLVGKWAGTASPGWRFQMTPSGRLRWEVVTRPALGSGQVKRSVFITYETVNDLAWHHVAATFDGQHLRVFRDGLPMHRWCGSGPREGVQPDGPNDSENCATPPPPPKTCPPIDTLVTDLPIPAGQTTRPVLGDIECIRGVIDNTQPVLAAADDDGNALDGFLDELRVSNYAKREFEVSASARPASAFTQTLGRGTILRNRFIWLDGTLVGPLSNSEPYDLAYQPARELSAFDLQGRRVSSVKHVVGQLSDSDYFVQRAAPDSLGGRGSLEYPHGEILVSGFDPDGTQRSLIGYGPQIGGSPAQSQAYVTGSTSAITGQSATLAYGNGVTTVWSYDDGPVPASMFGPRSGAFGPDSLKRVVVTGPGSTTLSDRAYDDWDAVGNLIHVHDGPYDATYTYDDLRRVRTATLAAPQNPAPMLYFDYDVLGNLTLVDGKDTTGALREGDGAKQAYGRAHLVAACPAGPNALPHALSERTVLPQPPLAGGTPTETRDALCYDASGKMLWSRDSLLAGDRSYIYFARSKPRSVSAANGRSHFLYDGNGVRVAKREDGRDTQIILDAIYREISPGLIAQLLGTPTLARFEVMYPSRGGIVARRVLTRASPSAPLTTGPDALNWLSKDHLGGTYFLTNLQGHEVASSRAYYRPYGGFIDGAHPPQSAGAGERLFTSKELDASGVYDVGARLYDPRTGRFTQADDAPTASDAQSNRFAYARNNPLLYVDPDGRDAIRVVDVKNAKATIVIPVHFVGEGATKEVIAATVDRAATLTLDPRDKYYADVPVDIVIVPTDTPIIGVLNTVSIAPFTLSDKVEMLLSGAADAPGYAKLGGREAFVDTGRLKTTEAIAGAAAHEILHLANMIDRYVVRSTNWDRTRNVAITREFPCPNIMSCGNEAVEKFNVRYEQLDEALQTDAFPLVFTNGWDLIPPPPSSRPTTPPPPPAAQPAPPAPGAKVKVEVTPGEAEMTVKYKPPPTGRRYDWDVPDYGRGAK